MSKRRRAILALLALIAAAGIAAAILLALGPQRRPNVLLISIDTLRADHLGCYGYGVSTSPNVDAFARRSILFETTVAAAPSTEPSHAAIFTSLLPTHHGALFARRSKLDDRFTTLAELLKHEGYRTMSVNDGGQMDAGWGLAQGFDAYTSLPGLSKLAKFSKTVATALRWLDSEEAESPWFVFLHTYEPHSPYDPGEAYYEAIGHDYGGPLPDVIDVPLLERINSGALVLGDADKRHVVAAYDGDIRSTDAAFGELLAALERRDLLDETIIIFTSDHGEELGEHGMMGWHSHALWDEQLLVPLLVGLPDGRFAGKRIRSQVRGIDILPTVLDLVGTTPLPEAEGRSLLPLVRGEPDVERPAVSERDVLDAVVPTSLRIGGRKMILPSAGAPPLLFDLAADPSEKKDLCQGDAEKAAGLRMHLDTLLAARPGAGNGTPIDVDAQVLKTLEELGYLARKEDRTDAEIDGGIR
ncbi:MAG: sulfatase-like hydrolase/transferase [Proteobacteria bacterium]|jgi:arylsulfatase A-like enzyme|nr:sulfatase-like hydrolase/transferase [Pseudomonadota bacterium]